MVAGQTGKSGDCVPYLVAGVSKLEYEAATILYHKMEDQIVRQMDQLTLIPKPALRSFFHVIQNFDIYLLSKNTRIS